MNKGKTKKEARKLIFKENKSHQEAFEILNAKSDLGNEELAKEISATPSKSQYNRLRVLILIYIAFLGTVLTIRTLTIFIIAQDIEQIPILLLLILLGIFLPVYGIYGAITARMEVFKSVGIFMAISMFRAISNNDVSNEITLYITIGLFAICAGFALFIPFKIKTPYTKKLVATEIDGNTKNVMEYTFDVTHKNDDDRLIDTI